MTKPEHWRLKRKNQPEPLPVGTKAGIFEITGHAMSLGVGRRYRVHCEKCGQDLVIPAAKIQRGQVTQHAGCGKPAEAAAG